MGRHGGIRRNVTKRSTRAAGLLPQRRPERAATWLLCWLHVLLVAAGGAPSAGKRRCRKAKDCESCTAIDSCGWCLDSERCLDKATHPTGDWKPTLKVCDDCNGTLQTGCLSTDPTQNSDRFSQVIERAVPFEYHSKPTPPRGWQIAAGLKLRMEMERIVATFPGASYFSTDPPIIRFTNFLSADECAAVIAAGEPSLQPSVGGWSTDDQELQQSATPGRSSYNAWCLGKCAADPTL